MILQPLILNMSFLTSEVSLLVRMLSSCTCPDDSETQVPTVINLDDIKVQTDKDHKKDIVLDADLTLRMSIPP